MFQEPAPTSTAEEKMEGVVQCRRHTGERPYKCSYCERRFKDTYQVKLHTRLHTGERPYKCHIPDCGRTFIQPSNLQYHLRNHESQVERQKNRPFHCSICGKSLATASSLKTHTDKHQALMGGPSNGCCPICNKKSMSDEILREHMQIAHKDPNASGALAKGQTTIHMCLICDKSYVCERSLVKHMACHPEMTSTPAPSFRMWPCAIDKTAFTCESDLLNHIDQQHTATEREEREALLMATMPGSITNWGIPSMVGMEDDKTCSRDGSLPSILYFHGFHPMPSQTQPQPAQEVLCAMGSEAETAARGLSPGQGHAGQGHSHQQTL